MTTQNKLKLVHLDRLFINMIDAETLDIGFKLSCCKSSQEHECGQPNLYVRLLTLCIEKIFDLLQHLNTVFQRHLEIKEHKVDRKKYFLVLRSALNRILDNNFNCVDCFLSVDEKLSFLCQIQLCKNVFQDFDVYQLIVSSYDFLHASVWLLDFGRLLYLL